MSIDLVLLKGSDMFHHSKNSVSCRGLIEADLVDCMVSLPGQLFYSTQIPVCLWFIGKNSGVDAKHSELTGKQRTSSTEKLRRETSAICAMAKCTSNYPWGNN